MDAKMSKVTIDCCREVWTAALTKEETAEMVVPDVMPDIAGIENVTGYICLRGKDIGQGTVTVTAMINCCVVYCPEAAAGVRKLELQIPCTITADAPGIDEDSNVVARLCLGSVDARALNPRKVLVRAEVCCEMEGYAKIGIEVNDALEQEEVKINVKPGKVEFTPIVAVREKTFVLTDEYNLPSTRPGVQEILSKRAELNCDDVKTVGNKLIFKGAAQVSVLYVGAGEGETVAVTYSTAFSQIIEMEKPLENANARLSLMLTGVFIEPVGPEARSISAELHVVAQAVGSDNLSLNYVEDAYSNEFPLALEHDELELKRVEREANLRETIRELVETTELVREIIDAYATPGTVSADGGTARCDVTISAMYRTVNDEIKSVSRRFSVSSRLELDADMMLVPRCAVCTETFATPAAGGIEFRVPVDIYVDVVRRFTIMPVRAVDIDMQSPISSAERPSITALMAGERHSIWSMAKKFGSTPELIMEANDVSEGDSVKGRFILIPRAR